MEEEKSEINTDKKHIKRKRRRNRRHHRRSNFHRTPPFLSSPVSEKACIFSLSSHLQLFELYITRLEAKTVLFERWNFTLYY